MTLPSIFPLLGIAQVLGYHLSPLQGFQWIKDIFSVEQI